MTLKASGRGTSLGFDGLRRVEQGTKQKGLVPRHSDYDGLALRRHEGRQGVLIDEYLNGSRGAGSSRDEAGLLELEHHLMDCGRRDFEEPYIGFGRGDPFTNVYA